MDVSTKDMLGLVSGRPRPFAQPLHQEEQTLSMMSILGEFLSPSAFDTLLSLDLGQRLLSKPHTYVLRRIRRKKAARTSHTVSVYSRKEHLRLAEMRRVLAAATSTAQFGLRNAAGFSVHT